MKKFISLFLTIVLIISLSACGKSADELTSAVSTTCFDKYYTSNILMPENPFEGMNLWEILVEYVDYSDFKWSVNDNIPYFDNFSADYDSKNNDFVCFDLAYEGGSSNTIFSVHKSTGQVVPIGILDESGQINNDPNEAITRMFLHILVGKD